MENIDELKECIIQAIRPITSDHRGTSILVLQYLELISNEFDAILNSNMALVFVRFPQISDI